MFHDCDMEKMRVFSYPVHLPRCKVSSEGQSHKQYTKADAWDIQGSDWHWSFRLSGLSHSLTTHLPK